MKRPFLLLSLAYFVLGVTDVFSQPTWVWANRAGASNTDYANSVCTSLSGDVYAAGLFYSPSVTIGTNTLINNGSASSDLFLAKYDGAGNVIWAVSAGSPADDAATSVTTDAAGNIYVTGWYSGTINFGTISLTNSGGADIFTAKYDPNGNALWVKQAGGANWDVPQSICYDAVNNRIYIGGYFGSDSVSFGIYTHLNLTPGTVDAFFTKYDTAGNVLFSYATGGQLNDLVNALTTDASGNLYITGGFASNIMPFPCGTLVNAGTGFPDVFTVKWDSAGLCLWAVREGGPDNDHTVSVSCDPFGNVYVAGHYHSTSFSVGTDLLINGGMGDPFIIKYTGAGNPIWARATGEMENDFAYTVVSDASGNAFLSGMFKSDSVLFGTTWLMNTLAINEDMFLAKYDSAGSVMWAVSEGGTNDDFIASMALDVSGAMYLTGGFQSPSVMLGTALLTNADNSGNTFDVFLGKLDVLTGKEEESEILEALVYPNPSTGLFTFSAGQVVFENGKIEVYNLLGEKFLEQHISASADLVIDLSACPKGVYFVKIVSGNKVYRQKAVVE